MTLDDKMLPGSWGTKDLKICDAELAEAESIRDIFNACSYVEPWDETFAPTDIETSEELVGKSVRGEDAFRLQTVRNRAGELIGYFHFRHAFPKPDVVWISMVAIHPDHQRKGVGTEVVEGVIRELQCLAKYRAVWLRVYLKNWPALRAWIKLGFRTIVEYRGDEVFSKNGHASLILERTLEGLANK